MEEQDAKFHSLTARHNNNDNNSNGSGNSNTRLRKVRKPRQKCVETSAFLSRQNAPAPKRKKSSEKERERNEEIKTKLQYLASHIPFVQKDLSRIRTLRLTKEYIKHLVRILQGETIICPHTGEERPLCKSDFKQVVNKELQTNNSYKDRADMELATVGSTAPPSSGCPSRLSFVATRENTPCCPLNDGPVINDKFPTPTTENHRDFDGYGLNSGYLLKIEPSTNHKFHVDLKPHIEVSPVTQQQLVDQGRNRFDRGAQSIADRLPLLHTFASQMQSTSSNIYASSIVHQNHIDRFYSYY